MSQILVIDDSEFDRRMMTLAMKSADEDLTFTELSRGEKAVETIHAVKPDIVLLDIRMPGLSGFEVLDRIRDEKSLEDCKVVMISGSCAEEDKAMSKKRGAAAYFTKPHSILDYETMARKIRGLYAPSTA